MSGVFKNIGKIAVVALGVAAIVFTAGAAIPAVGALLTTTLGLSAATVAGGFSGVVGSALADVGLTGAVGDIIGGAVADAGIGAAAGGAIAGITGKNVISGMESGAATGALVGGVGGALGLSSVASGAAANASDLGGAAGDGMTSDLEMATGGDSAAASGAAGDLTGATVSNAPAVTSSPVSAAASNGPAGGLTSNLGAGPSYSPGSGYEGASSADTSSAPSVASNGVAGTAQAAVPTAGTALPNVKIPGSTYIGQDGITYVSNGATWDAKSGGGLLSSVLGKGGALGNGGLGSVISGVGQGLGTAQAAQDQVKGAQAIQKSQADITAGNYGTAPGAATSSSFMLKPAAAQNGLPSPTQAFNPTSRWVYDPTQQRLVLVPGSGQGQVTGNVPTS